MKDRFPDRTPIETDLADATAFPVHGAPVLVLFLYNSFRAALIEKLITRIEQALSGPNVPRLFLVYYNPVHHGLFDARAALSRYCAERMTFDDAEAITSPFSNTFDSVVIYQGGPDPRPSLAGAERGITIPDFGANVDAA